MVLRTGSSIGFQAQVWYLQPAAEPLREDSSLTTACAECRGTRALLPPLPWHKTEYNNTGACASATAVLPTAPGTSSSCTQTARALLTATTTTHRQLQQHRKTRQGAGMLNVFGGIILVL